MSRRRLRLPEPVRMAVAILDEHGRTADVDLGNGARVKIRWISSDGRHRLLVLAHSPSDHRANANARATSKRILRQEERP